MVEAALAHQAIEGSTIDDKVKEDASASPVRGGAIPQSAPQRKLVWKHDEIVATSGGLPLVACCHSVTEQLMTESRVRPAAQGSSADPGVSSYHVSRHLEPAEFVDGAKRAPRG